METCIATSNVPTSQYKMYHDNLPCGKTQIYTDTVAWIRLKLHKGKGTISVLIYNSKLGGDLCANILHFCKTLIGLVFRLHMLCDTWLHYWPYVPCETQKQRQFISQNILNLPDTENTEHMRFKACLYLLTVPHHQQKTAQYWMSWNKNHIKNKLYNVEFCPQPIVSDTVFTQKYLGCGSYSNMTSNCIQCAHTLCVENT